MRFSERMVNAFTSGWALKDESVGETARPGTRTAAGLAEAFALLKSEMDENPEVSPRLMLNILISNLEKR